MIFIFSEAHNKQIAENKRRAALIDPQLAYEVEFRGVIKTWKHFTKESNRKKGIYVSQKNYDTRS